MEIVNWKILGHPMNWITLFLMVLIGGIAMHLILTHLPTVVTRNTVEQATKRAA